MKKANSSQRMTTVGAMVGGVAHEINNPLTYVTANLEFIEEEIASYLKDGSTRHLTEAQGMIREVREGADRVRRILNDLRVFSRATSAAPYEVEPKELVASAVCIALNHLKHRAKLVQHYNCVPKIQADGSRLIHVLVGLLLNAASSCRSGESSDQNRLVIECRCEGSHVVFRVSDNGTGRPQEPQSEYIEPLGAGTGLTLHACRETMEAMGGELTIARVPGMGTSLVAAIPATDVASESPASRILVLDHDPGVAARFANQADNQCEVTATNHPPLAFEMLSEMQEVSAMVCEAPPNPKDLDNLVAQFVSLRPNIEDCFFVTTTGRDETDYLEAYPERELRKPLDGNMLERVLRKVR